MVEDHDLTSVPLYELVIDGALLALFCAFGIVANLLVLFTLASKKMKSSFTYYLQHLAVYDLLFLVVKVVLHVVHVFTHRHNRAVLQLYRTTCRFPSPFTVALMHIARTGSILTTVGMSFERYIVVCHPLKALIFCSVRRTILLNFFMGVFVVTFNIPRLFQHEVLHHVDDLTNHTYHVIIKTAFGKSYFFVNVYQWMSIILINVLPLFSLLFLNISIYRTIRKARIARHEMTQKQQTDAKFATTLFCVVIVYFICYTPSFLYLTLRTTAAAKSVTEYIVPLLHLTEAINSSVNFIIYAAVSKNFRDALCHALCKWCSPRKFDSDISKRSQKSKESTTSDYM